MIIAADLDPMKQNVVVSTVSVADSASTRTVDMPSPAVSVVRSIAHQAASLARHVARFPKKVTRDTPPDMAKMRQVAPVFDHDLGKWVWPNAPQVHRDEPVRRPHKQHSAASSRASSRVRG